MKNEIATQTKDEFLSLIEKIATNPEVNVEKLEKILDMKIRVSNKQAEIAFSAAFSRMQPLLPEIIERTKAHNSKYATLEDINQKIKPILAAHGFGISFRVHQDAASIKVTGVLSHSDGHREETDMIVPADNSGSKNAVQAIGSSVSYAKRYVMCALLNISTRGEDDNGGAMDAKPTEAQLESIKKLLLAATDKARADFTEKYQSLDNVKSHQVDSLTAWLKKNKEKP